MSEAIDKQRRGTDSLWFAVLERFGLPTLLVLLFLWKGLGWVEEDRRERQEILAKISENMTAQTIALRELAARVKP